MSAIKSSGDLLTGCGLLSLVTLAACQPEASSEARFLHIVVPDLVSEASVPAADSSGSLASLEAALRAASHLPGTSDIPEVIVLTGVAPSLPAAIPGTQPGRDSAAILAAQPGKQILVVPRPDNGLSTKPNLWKDVGAKAASSNVVRNLTTCYNADSLSNADCFSDLPASGVRLVGFPAFPATPPSDSDSLWRKSMDRWVIRLDSLITLSLLASKPVVVVSDFPDLMLWPNFGVSPATVNRFRAVVAKDPVLGIVGGRPFATSSSNQLQQEASEGPLVTRQLMDTSTRNGSGFTLVEVVNRRLRATAFRRVPATLAFVPVERSAVSGSLSRPSIDPQPVSWLWDLHQRPDKLTFWAVTLIALLLAFLTVANLWQIPEATKGSPVSTNPAPASPTTAAANAPVSTSSSAVTTVAKSVFDTNLGKTVLAGLSGLAALALFEEVWANAGFSVKAYYVVVFVVGFAIILLASAVFRGVTETLRHRIATRVMPPTQSGLKPGRLLWLWVLSLRGSAIVFFDTLFNVFQGRNQLQSAAFTDEIVRHYLAILATVGRVRDQVDAAIRGAGIQGQVRVGITLLDHGGKELYYVRQALGSLRKVFDDKSIAWLAVVAGRPLWWAEGYDPDTVLFDNSTASSIPGVSPKPTIEEYFQYRGRSDYEAFIVIPFPWGPRDPTEIRGAIQVSFADKADMTRLFANLVDPNGNPNYDAWQQLREPFNPQVLDAKVHVINSGLALVIRESLEVLAAVFSSFDSDFYKNYRDRLSVNP
jgi:hypothetical protein